MYETALRADAQTRLASIGRADLVVGIPSYRNAKTIAPVMQAAALGLARHFPSLRGVIAVTDGGSTDETQRIAETTPLNPPTPRIVTAYQGLLGRGSGLRAIMEITHRLGARGCVILPADLSNPHPVLLRRLAAPVVRNGYEYVLPAHKAVTLTTAMAGHLAYPFLRALFNTEVRHAIAGALAVSRAMAHDFISKDVWETDVARGGVDVWMTTWALTEKRRVCQVTLPPLVPSGPDIGFEFTFIQAIGTLFRFLNIYRKRWRNSNNDLQQVPFFDHAEYDDAPATLTWEELWKMGQRTTQKYQRAWQALLPPKHLAAVTGLLSHSKAVFPVELWVKIVYDLAVVYNKGEGDPDKVVGALLPLFYLHTAAWLRETSAHKGRNGEVALAAQAEEFRRWKPYLIERWETYLPWDQDLEQGYVRTG